MRSCLRLIALALTGAYLCLGTAAAVDVKDPNLQLSATSGAPGDQLTLDESIKRAIANNRTIQIARLALRSAEIAYKNAWDTMYMPQASLSVNSTSNFGVVSINPQVGGDFGYPSSTVALTLGNMTLFNFWRDWIVYEQADLDWRRAKELFDEGVRAVRFQVIQAYFRLKAEQEKLDSSTRSVETSEAILELVKSKVRIRKATAADVGSSEVDLLNTRNDFYTHQTSERSALWNLDLLLGDPVDTPYQLKDTLRHVPFTFKTSQALKIYWEQAPTLKNGKRDVRKAELGVELAEKNQIPVPKIGFSGVTLSYANGYYATTASPYGIGSGDPNVGVSAAISLTVPIYGPGGLFNERVVTQAEIARDQATVTYEDAANRDISTLYTLMISIAHDQDTIKNNKQAFEKSSALLDGLFAKLSKGDVNRLELRDAITQARTSELNLFDSDVQFLVDKLSLAQLIGVDHIPGDIY